ncbi:MAG: hypothetical protein GXP30_15115 [Verrucomicrobia bacterium]|nr:hypothetical protein [Verrucomicrobiota bacterium]
MKTVELTLYLGGVIHFFILFASVMAPKVMKWDEYLEKLPRMLRQMFWVYGVFIVLVIVSFGTLTLMNVAEMASGQGLGRGLCAVIAVFWAARLAVQLFIFDVGPFLTNWFYRLGYHLLTLAFVILVSIYGYASVQ